MDDTMFRIHDLLHRLGLTENYKGFFYTACAVELCSARAERLSLVTKLVYPAVARRYQTNWKSVERDIRTAGRVIWRRGRSSLEELAGAPLSQKPPNAQLLAILSSLTPPATPMR